MKINKMKLFYTVLFFLPMAHLSLKAQKLPEIQTANVVAPKAIRIDGKIQEWDDVFAADNKRTNLLYTVANDDKNLYLVVKAINNDAITKIMAGGISFTINTKGKKKETDGFTVTYPLLVRNNANRPGGQGQNRQRLGQNRTEQTQEQRDSITLEQRKTQLAGIKEIKVLGFPTISDSLISIYNEYGIKTVAKIDEQGAYVYEMAIPFSMLALSLEEKKEITYQIKLNGRSNAVNFTLRTNAAGRGFGAGNNRGSFGGGNANTARQDLMVATDFWGKYVIQKQ
ncbi:hypothetical protein [Pedobacter sp. UBA4863]|uniref:hypothetical protein n=1 Tax=Pedobacter sp. UBA4863 TaxID=1947060 RepID=UPI0025E31D59|nr:hypothetical protein [Pedobacter sp. UBA4863]